MLGTCIKSTAVAVLVKSREWLSEHDVLNKVYKNIMLISTRPSFLYDEMQTV